MIWAKQRVFSDFGQFRDTTCENNLGVMTGNGNVDGQKEYRCKWAIINPFCAGIVVSSKGPVRARRGC